MRLLRGSWARAELLLSRMGVLAVVLSLPVCLAEVQDRQNTAENTSIEKEIIATEELKNAAMQKGDGETLERIYADDLIFVNARGQVLAKSDRVNEFKGGKVRYISFLQGGYQLHIYGATVVLTGYSCSVVEYHGSINAVPRRFTSTYVKINGTWRFVAHQATLVSDDAALCTQ